MEKTVKVDQEFWSDGSNWIALPAGCDEDGGLDDFACKELHAKDWCFFQTSGSEGLRKWVGLTKESLRISALAVNAHFDITEHDRWLLALPVHHVGGFGVLARACLSGSKVTRLAEKWDAQVFVDTCEDVCATLTSLVPTQVFDLVAAKLRAPRLMRAVLVGGGALNSEVEAAALGLGWPVRRTYGMTETASQVASQRAEGGGMEVLPVWQVSTDAEGVLTVRGAALAQGYAIPAAGGWRWEAIPAEVGLRTRDCVDLWHEAGRQCLRFKSRVAGTVKILGELVTLGPIQERLETLLLEMGLRAGEAVVCDVPDRRRETRLILAVNRMSDEDAAALQARVNGRLRPFERITEVRHLDSIPRSTLGKVKFGALREMLLQDRA